MEKIDKDGQSIYNEERYLKGETEIMKFFAEYLENLEDTCIIENILYRELIDKYDELITRVADLIRSLGYSSSIECSLDISYLIKNGYLSADQEFEWDFVDSNKELKTRLGCEVVKGSACCRHLSSMHKNIFNRLGLPFKELYVYHGNNSFNKALNSQANHVISLIRHDDVEYGIDIGNSNRLYRFETPFILRELAVGVANHLRYKPYYELTHGDSKSLEEIKRNLERFGDLSKAKTIHPFDYQANYRQKTERKLRRNEAMFADFHESTKVLKKEIKELIISEVYQKD